LIDTGRWLKYDPTVLTASIVGFSDANGEIEALLRSDISLIKEGRELGFPKLSRREVQDRLLNRTEKLLRTNLELIIR
jgi:hypothetical protein